MKLAENSVFSEVRASTSSQTTASDGAPFAAISARSAASEIWESMSSIAIDPSSGMPSSFRSETITLASSRATSQRITSPTGLCAAPSRRIRLQTEGALSSSFSAFSALSGGSHDSQVDHAG